MSPSSLLESDSDTPISFRSSLSVRFLVKVKFLSIFWRCVIRAHRKNSSLESFRIFLIYHTCDLTARMHCATEKNTMQQRYTAQHWPFLMHPYKPILSWLKHTYFFCFLSSVYSSDWITLMIKAPGEPTSEFKRKLNCFMLNPSSGIQKTMGHQTIAVPNVLYCDKLQWCTFFKVYYSSSCLKGI